MKKIKKIISLIEKKGWICMDGDGFWWFIEGIEKPKYIHADKEWDGGMMTWSLGCFDLPRFEDPEKSLIGVNQDEQ